MKTLRQAILEFDETHVDELIDSAINFDIDLEKEYPNNLHLIDGENVDREKYEGDEYIEYSNGIPVYIMYSL